MGFRYKKEVNGETHNYIFDGWSITAETNKYGELKSREVRGYGLVKKEIDNKQYYYHQNEHGDIIHLTNTDSEVENYYQYDVFGNMREQQENVENIFKYTGEQQDKGTEQYYLRARFYNQVIARFTQEDVYRGDGLNLYVYVVNNPLLWIDPSGYTKCPNKKENLKETELFLPDEYYQRMDNYLAKAIAARNAEVVRLRTLSNSQRDKIVTVVAGVDIRTGEVYVGAKNSTIYKGQASCAEDIVFRGLGGNQMSNIIMTPAIRPRTMQTIDVCDRCQTHFPKNQFMKGTNFE